MSIETISFKKPVNVFKLFQLAQKEKLNYIYRGVFTSNITKNILSLAESCMTNKDEPRELKRKVYHVMVEGLQNIIRHQTDTEPEARGNYGMFALKKDQCSYFITTGNLIENESIGNLTKKIKQVNNLDKTQLKDYHKEILQYGTISEKGGAGLGLIEIARRSGSKLLYAYNPISTGLSYFYLHTKITSAANQQQSISANKGSLSTYNTLHNMLEKENILIAFTNSFNQENLFGMLSFIEQQMAASLKLQRQIYRAMLEICQNIIKHASIYNASLEEKSGLFYISENNNECFLNAGNYILNNKIRHLKSELNNVNNMDADGLENLYNNRLFNFENNTNKGAGLGLIDLRLKSGNKLDFDFQKINENYSFYSLRAKISKT